MLNELLVKQYAVSALKEDHYRQDMTSQILISPDHRSQAIILAKEDGVICGLQFIPMTFRLVDSKLQVVTKYHDGMNIKKGNVLAIIRGKTRSLLSAERTALNFVSYLSGIATQTHHYVQAVKPFKAKILDTRKTTPTLRMLEKYAVKCGGGENHRFHLKEMILIKDNHLAASQPKLSIEEVIQKFRKKTKAPIELEIDHLSQLNEALKTPPDFILLDNMTIPQLKKAVDIVKHSKLKTKPLLEASGGITLKNVRAVAQTGVDRISIGALTHTHRCLDVSMEISHVKPH